MGKNKLILNLTEIRLLFVYSNRPTSDLGSGLGPTKGGSRPGCPPGL